MSSSTGGGALNHQGLCFSPDTRSRYRSDALAGGRRVGYVQYVLDLLLFHVASIITPAELTYQ